MKIVHKIRKECFLLARKKICHFIDPRHSSLDPRHLTLDPLHSPLDSRQKVTLDYSVENVHCTISTMSCHGTQQNMHRPLKLESFVFPMKVTRIIT